MKKLLFTMIVTLLTIAAQNTLAQEITTTVGGVKFDVKRCLVNGKGLVIEMTATNQTNKELGYRVNYNIDGHGSIATDDEGNGYGLWHLFAGNAEACCTCNRITLPQGVKVKFFAYFHEVPEGVTYLRQFAMDGLFTKNGEEDGQRVILKDIPVEALQNSDQPSLTCTLAETNVKSMPLKRNGSSVEVDFTLTMQSDKDIIIFDDTRLRTDFYKITVYDNDGNSYDADIVKGNRSYLEVGMPVTFTLQIQNVPDTVKGFSLIRAEFEGRQGYKVEWKGVRIGMAN